MIQVVQHLPSKPQVQIPVLPKQQQKPYKLYLSRYIIIYLLFHLCMIEIILYQDIWRVFFFLTSSVSYIFASKITAFHFC
jgi:hypothetical protein